MIQKKLALTNEQTSPLFRIMWLYNANEPARRFFDSNISTFHIGNGLILSVAHNLRSEIPVIKTISDEVFQAEIIPKLNPEDVKLFNQAYQIDYLTNNRHLNLANPNDVKTVSDILKAIHFDTRLIKMEHRGLCKPHLIVQLSNDQFYNDAALTSHFNPSTCFHEPSLNRHTFLIEVELLEAFYSEDMAIYKIVNTHQEIVKRLPSISIDFSILDDNQTDFYCLQSSPNGFLGRLLNKAQIEGFLDHHGMFGDRFGGGYIFEGLRYLIKGYFRFGSSGAPYVFFDKESGEFKVNAIQSEACPIQLSIGNNKEGNYQYINALASPLEIIEERIRKYLDLENT